MNPTMAFTKVFFFFGGEKRDLCIGFLDEEDTQIIFSQGNISLGIISFSLEFILDGMMGVL
jgi:hypothetical protein